MTSHLFFRVQTRSPISTESASSRCLLTWRCHEVLDFSALTSDRAKSWAEEGNVAYDGLVVF